MITCSVAAVTTTGAWYGADLKTKQDIKEVRLGTDTFHFGND